MKIENLKPFIIVCGHYGCGKTNLSLNMALDYAAAGERVTLVDLDLVNPYFRSSDFRELAREHGVELIAPAYAGTTLDTPALLPEIASVFEKEGRVILDVGGDDAGATALGRYNARIRALNHDFLYVVNRYRPLSREDREAEELLAQIEAASRLKATAVVNNSHLKQFTTAQTILDSVAYAEGIASHLGLPLEFTSVPVRLAGEIERDDLYPVRALVRTPWENDWNI